MTEGKITDNAGMVKLIAANKGRAKDIDYITGCAIMYGLISKTHPCDWFTEFTNDQEGSGRDILIPIHIPEQIIKLLTEIKNEMVESGLDMYSNVSVDKMVQAIGYSIVEEGLFAIATSSKAEKESNKGGRP